MYKVLLVDDEALIREAISENIRWEEMGFHFMGACENGRQAVAVIEREQPDLLLTDINMPFMDGMELTKFVYENYPDTKVIIISGFDEFEYAKNAVKYQVLEYILKPVTPTEFTETLLRVKNLFDEKRKNQRDMRKIRSAYVSNLPTMRGKYLHELLNGTADCSKLEKKQEELKLCLKAACYNTAIIEADSLESFVGSDASGKDNLALFAIFNIAEEIVTGEMCGTVFQAMDERTIILFMGEDQEHLKEKMHQVFPMLQKAIMSYLGIPVTIAVGTCVFSLEELPKSYAKTKNALEYKTVLGGNQVIEAEALSNQRDSYGKQQAMLAQEYIEKNYSDSSVTLNSVCSALAMSTSYFSVVFKNHTGETFIEALTKKRMEKAKLLLEQGKMKTYEVAEAVGYSDAHYFSISFKKAVGKTPTEYAKEVRKA